MCGWTGPFTGLIVHLANAHCDFVDADLMESFQCLGCKSRFLSRTLHAAHDCADSKTIRNAFLLRPFMGTGRARTDDMLKFVGIVGGTILEQALEIEVKWFLL